MLHSLQPEQGEDDDGWARTDDGSDWNVVVDGAGDGCCMCQRLWSWLSLLLRQSRRCAADVDGDEAGVYNHFVGGHDQYRSHRRRPYGSRLV